MAEYTRDTVIRDVLVSRPDAVDVFRRHGLGCGSCLGADMETLDAVASMHDVPVDVLISELNALSAHSPAEDSL